MATKTDYAPKTTSKPPRGNGGSGSRKPRTPRKSPPPRKATVNPEKRPLAGWVWLVAGLLIGLFVAMLVFLADQKPPQGTVTSKQKPATVKATSNKPTKKKQVAPKPKQPTKQPVKVKEDRGPSGVKYEYHRILKGMEMEIPAEELKYQSTQSAKEVQSFVIQAGSFRKLEDAESRIAELFLLNFDPRIERVDSSNGKEWHRIHIGPFKDRRALDQARRRLQDNNINFITLKKSS
jgi:cell division protein FtsN